MSRIPRASRIAVHCAAAAWAALFAAPHLWWALGVPVGCPGGAPSHRLMMTTWRLYFDIAVVGMSLVAVFVALAPVQAWSDAIPRTTLRVLSVIAACMLGLRGLAGMIVDGRSDPVWWPTFLTGGLLFGATAFCSRDRARSSPSPPSAAAAAIRSAR